MAWRGLGPIGRLRRHGVASRRLLKIGITLGSTAAKGHRRRPAVWPARPARACGMGVGPACQQVTEFCQLSHGVRF